MGDNSSLKINGINLDTLVVSFAGHDLIFGHMPRFEFVNFFHNHLNHVSRHFYVDNNKTSYHKGITGISNSIEETVEYLRNEIKPYKNVIFLGASSGGYAAILFGSLLEINSVVAFIPQTVRRDKVIDEKYRDISTFINKTTNYFLHSDTSVSNSLDPHHVSHCDRISQHPNVFITKQNPFNLKKMRDNGELYTLLNRLIMLETKNKHTFKLNFNS